MAALWVVTSRAALKKLSLVFLHALTLLRVQEQSVFLHGPFSPSCPPSFGAEDQDCGAEGGRSPGLHHHISCVCSALAMLLGSHCPWELLPAGTSH